MAKTQFFKYVLRYISVMFTKQSVSLFGILRVVCWSCIYRKPVQFFQEALVLGKEDESRLIRNRRLVLLVDLDQTLIHTTNENIAPNIKDVYHFQVPYFRWTSNFSYNEV